MKNWRTVVGALCIMAAMVLGAFAGLSYAKSGGVSVSPDQGTRGEDRRLVSAFDENQKVMTAPEAEAVASHTSGLSLLDSQASMTSSSGTVTVKPVSAEEIKAALLQGATVTYHGEHGDVSMRTATTEGRTRGGTLWAPGAISAGGPYGGPDTFEGGPDIVFTVTVNDPALQFFRWDFNNDGKFDVPKQTSPGNLGDWIPDQSVTKQFFDDYFGKVVVQAWDGTSTIVTINTGDNGLSAYNIQFLIGFGTYTFANRITAKANVKVTQLGHYHYAYNLFESAIYSGSTGQLLAQCTAVHITFQWNWCTLPTPIDFVQGQDYVIGVRTTSYGNLISAAADTSKVHYNGLYYCFSSSLCYPSTFFSAAYTLMVDFKWEETLILPDAAEASATLDINNVAPSVFGVVTTPQPALEGSPAQLSAQFSDPGLDDTWDVRWTLHDGRVSPWLPITKYNGGAKVLLLTSYSGNVPGELMDKIVAKCGNFCTRVASLDFGAIGENRVPALSELTKYDVLVVGTNYVPADIGDRLAQYMDAAGSTGGGVVMLQGGFADNIFGIGGRWQSDKYSPVARDGYNFVSSGLGTIYVPGHPILDGVSTFSSGLRGIQTTTQSGVRIADFVDGRVAIATNTNPKVANGARAVAHNWFPLSGFANGDYIQVIVNSIRWASRQPDPTIKAMPITTDPFEIAFKDDDPTTTTPQDSFVEKVEVRDDDNGKIRVTGSSQMSFNDFENTAQCNGQYYLTTTWPPSWSSSPNPFGWTCNYVSTFGSRGPNIWYYYNDPLYGTGNGHSYVYTPTFDFSSWFAARVQFDTYWLGNFPGGDSDGVLEASTDGGATWSVELTAYHHNNPSSFRGSYSTDNTAVGGFSTVQFRFRYESNNDWWWFVDNVKFIGIAGSIVNGLGSATGAVTVANVPPTTVGGFDTALRMEAQGLQFKGFQISDPALLEPTEWFAYQWNFDDGTPTDWRYVGTLAPPRLKVFIIHTICLGLIAATCPDYNSLRNTLLAQDDVASVDGWDFINYPQTPTAPPLSKMMQYDVIIVATNWAYFNFAPFNTARRFVGDRLADYLDSGRGGALTMMCVYCLSGGNDLFNIRGRYLDDQYGAYKNANYLFPGSSGIDVFDQEHDIFVQVNPDNVGSLFIHAGKQALTVGGNNNAQGQDGISLANWKDGTSAVGIKNLNNGMRTAHFGAFGNPTGSSTGMLLRNMVGWVAGGIPSPKIAPFTHTYGDNGVYNVALTLIDDDMGWTWDVAGNKPMQALSGASLSTRVVPVTVDNVDPTIDKANIQAFIAANACLRITGKSWGSATLKLFTDGVQTNSVTVTRSPGSPKDQTKCTLVKIDVLADHTMSATVAFAKLAGKTSGSNPFWVSFDPWRRVEPGHGTRVFSGVFKVEKTSTYTQTMDLKNLRRQVFDHGRGAPVEFAVTAADPGTDDLAFVWTWGDGVAETVNVHKNIDSSVVKGTIADPQHLGFAEPFFDRTANTGRSPDGTMGFTVRDTTTHVVKIQSHDCDDDASGGAGPTDDDDCDDENDCDDDAAGGFGAAHDDDDDDDCAEQALFMWVQLTVLDDDNTRGYASPFFHDGTDMELLVLHLS